MAEASSSVLIMGGSGFIGTALASYLTSQGCSVSILSRSPEKIKEYSSFFWNPELGQVDYNAFLNQDYIINLCGTSIGAKYWTRKRKQEIIDSRIKPLQILDSSLKKIKQVPKKVLTASAIGIYGSAPGVQLDENSPEGKGFLANVCKQWEQEADVLTCPVVKMRIGVVLSDEGGFVEQMTKILRTRLNVIWGNGRQKVSWIHLYDLVRAIYFLMNSETQPVYNLTSPCETSSRALNRLIARSNNFRPLSFKLPKHLVKALLGSFSELFFNDQNAKPEQLTKQGFSFRYNKPSEVFVQRV